MRCAPPSWPLFLPHLRPAPPPQVLPLLLQKHLQKPDRTLFISKGPVTPTWGPSPRPPRWQEVEAEGFASPGLDALRQALQKPLRAAGQGSVVGILPRPRPGSSGDSSERDSASLPQAFPSARRPVSILALATGKLGPALSLESLGFCHLLRSLLLLRGFSILSSHLSNLVVHNFYRKLPLTSSKADRIYVINRNKSRGNLPMLLSYFWSYHKPGLGVCDQFSTKHFMHRHVLKLFSVKDPDAVVLDSQLKTFKGKGCRHGYFKQRLCATPH